MEHPKELKELSKIMFYQMEDYSQIVHDLLEILCEEITCFEPHISLTGDEQKMELAEIMRSISYDVNNLLEVIAKERVKDIYALNKIKEIINLAL